MHNKVVYRIARGLRASGAVVLRFNYRGVNLSQGTYDHGVGEIDDAGTSLATLRDRYPALPILLAGFSFGSRIVQKLGCETAGAKRIVAVGFPVLNLDGGKYTDCAVPRVFIQSPNDQFGPRGEFQKFFDSLRGEKQLIWVESGDHFFAGALDEFEAAVRSVRLD
jgi:alpha/beta superfamily hydrolase